MIRVVSSLATLFGVMALAGCSSTNQVYVDWDRNVDFSGFGTYSFLEGRPASNPLVQKQIWSLLEREMEARGFERAEGIPDLWVTTHANLGVERRVNVTHYGYSYGWYGWGWYGGSTAHVYDVPKGSLVVDIVDARSKELEWRGVGTGELYKKPEKNAAKIDKMISKMFKDFPVTR
jgi:hypothetical protein